MDAQYNTRKTLIQRVQDNHDEQSWEEFDRIYRPYVCAIILDMNIVHDDVDDIAQTIMLKLWKYIQSYSADKRFRSWLSSVSRNCVKDYIKQRMRDIERKEELSKHESFAYLKNIRLPDLEKIAEKEWEIYLVQLALKRVEGYFSGSAVRVFVLSVEGLGIAEIAKKTGLKENSVYRLKNRVKERMTAEIEQLRAELG